MERTLPECWEWELPHGPENSSQTALCAEPAAASAPPDSAGAVRWFRLTAVFEVEEAGVVHACTPDQLLRKTSATG